jgi:hypothetical protein
MSYREICYRQRTSFYEPSSLERGGKTGEHDDDGPPPPPNDGSFTETNHSPAMGLKQWPHSGLRVDIEAYLIS